MLHEKVRFAKTMNKIRHNRKTSLTHRLINDVSGAVTMEYVLLAVLIAAGALFAVINFSRSIFGMIHVATYMMTAQPDKAANALNIYKKDRAADAEEAQKWVDSLHR